MKPLLYLLVAGAFIFSEPVLFSEPALAQKLVDPNAVAPEYREAAQKRRAEQIRQHGCARKAAEAKVMPRDRIAHITKCLAEAEAEQPPTSTVAHKPGAH